MLLQGKNAIVTGARSGIGLATVHLFAKNGCNIWAVVHRDDEEFLANIAQWEQEYEVWIKPIHIDLNESESIKVGMKLIMQEKLPIDILVNAAGIVSPNRLFSMTKMEDIRKVMEVNFFSAIELTQLVCRTMMRQRNGSIVNICSIAAWGEDTSQMEYAASKAALTIATKKLARELGAAGIRVNAVCPGMTKTPMIHDEAVQEEQLAADMERYPLKRYGEPKEIALGIIYLLSEASSWTTGINLVIDGGLTTY